MGQQAAAGRLIEPPRAVLQLLRQAEQAAAQRRYSEAVVALGELLQRQPAVDDDDELSGQDFFLDIPEVSPIPSATSAVVRRTLFGEARRLLSEMPPAALETYELRYGPEARELLERAAPRRDWKSVAEVRRRFFHTSAGRDATALLAQRAVSLGRPSEAIRLLEALRSHPKLDAASRDGVNLMLLAMRQAGSEPTAAAAPPTSAAIQELPATARQAAGQPVADQPAADPAPQIGEVVLEGQPVQPPTGEALPNWLADRFGRTRERGASGNGDVTMLGLDPSRRESSQGQMPLSIPRWIARTAATPSQERLLEEAAEAMASMGDVAPPAWLPLRVGNQVLMRSTERLYGLDFQTGKLIWQYPWFDSGQEPEASDLAALLMEEESGQSLLKQRVWNDLPYGRITSDGKRVFMLADLAEVEASTFNPLLGLQGAQSADSGSNSLVALDLATEGKLVWRLGGRSDEVSGWGETFFLGPPLPLDDALYVMAEVSGDIVLICLDAASGLERWRQQLLAVESGGISSDPIRRVAGATPSYAQGMLICSTGAGAIIGFDLHDQSLAWALTIPRNEALNQTVRSHRDSFSPEHLLKRWWDGTPRISGDTIFVTPIESDRLFAIDLLTGERRWKELARSQTGSRYLAGVRDSTLVLVGSDHVRGVDAARGQNTWKTAAGWLDAGEQVSGVGVFGAYQDPQTGQSQPSYFVPTSSNRIIAVSLVDGTVLGRRETQFPTGNLIAAGGQILAQSPTSLAVAYGQQTLEPAVAAALAANPQDFQAIIRQAELLMQRGQLSEALQWLNRAREMNPEDIDAENLSVRAMLSALREDFAGNIDLLPQLDQLIYMAADRVELIKLQVRAAVSRNQPERAVGRLIELSGLIAREPSLGLLGRSSESDASRQVSLDNWLAARVREALEIADEAQRAAINELVVTHLDQFTEASTPLIKRLLVHFGTLPGSHTLAQSLVNRYREEQAFLAMERLVLETGGATPETLDRLAPWQLTALAQAYTRGGLSLDAAAVIETLAPGALDQSAPLRADNDLLASLELSTQELRDVIAAAQPISWTGTAQVRLPQEALRSGIGRKPAIGETRRVVGRSFRGWQLISDDSSPFAIRDPRGSIHPIPLDGMNRREEISRQAVFNGGLMIAVLPGELVGVNLFEVLRGQIDSVIWRRPWRTDSSGGGIKPRSESTPFGDQVYRYVISTGPGSNATAELQLGPIVGNTFYVLQGGELIAYDALTAEPRWRNLETPQGGSLVCDGEVIAIVSPTSQQIVKYDCRDGRRLGEEPFEDYRIWAASDQYVLAYRESTQGTRDLVLLNPISGRELLRHTFEDLSSENRVFGRIVNGRYVVTLSTTGEVLIWDIQHGQVVSRAQLEPLESLRGLQVLAREDSLVLLPNTSDIANEHNGVPLHVSGGQDHVRVDSVITALSTADGEVLWQHSLKSLPWGCTLTQSPISPLLMLSRSKPHSAPNRNRLKLIDVMAIDTRDGSAITTLDRPMDSFNNDIETRITLQPAQQRVLVNIGTQTISYEFAATEQPSELEAVDEPIDADD